jgi:hypothetical protein
MAFTVKDRVKETTTTDSTGTVTLLGASSGFQAFSAVGDGNTTYYASMTVTGNVTATEYYGSGSNLTGVGGGLFKGNNGQTGSSAGDIFRINVAELSVSTSINSDENASATGPLSVLSGATLTVSGTLVII